MSAKRWQSTNYQEEKAMIISDLNYLEAVEANVEGATGYTYFQNSLNLGLTKKFTVGAVLFLGNQADASSGALAIGNNTYTKTDTVTFATPVSSASSSWSTSAVSPH